MRRTTHLDKAVLRLLLVTGFTILISYNVIAAEFPTPAKPNTAQQDNKEQQSDKKRISTDAVKMFLNQIEIYGQIAKPQTVFILPGSDPRVDGLRIQRPFFGHIFRSVEKSALKRTRLTKKLDKDYILW